MSESKSLLIEIGTEELPPKSLDELAAAFAAGITGGLAKRDIAADVAGAKTYCSPRRLAVLVPRVARMQPDSIEEIFGPPVSVGRDANGEPTKALLGFAKKCGVEVGALQELAKADGTYFGFRREKRGQPTASLMSEIVVEALKALPIPKPMRWGDHDYSFVRPAHWLVMLHGTDVVAPARVTSARTRARRAAGSASTFALRSASSQLSASATCTGCGW